MPGSDGLFWKSGADDLYNVSKGGNVVTQGLTNENITFMLMKLHCYVWLYMDIV